MPKPSKTVEQRKQRVASIVPKLRKLYPDAKCSLDFTTPLELIVATILSAQSTDKRVNLVTPTLFKKYKSARAYAEADPATLEKEIQSTGFYRNKAKSILAMAKALVEKHDGEVPRTMEELTQLAGVGRKTANVVLGNAFNTNVGVTVDTHVTRLANRLALTKYASDAVKIEQDLIEILPQGQWCEFSHLLIYHGRSLCTARAPRCQECPLLPDCPAGQKLVKAVLK